MRLLLIEDEEHFIKTMRAACQSADSEVRLVLADDLDLANISFSESAPIEEQLSQKLIDDGVAKKADIVLLDTDLSRKIAGLRTQSEYRLAFQSVGVPVCRYRKRHSSTPLAAFQFLARLSKEGTSAVWVPTEFLEGDFESKLIPWLIDVNEGFREIRKEVEKLSAEDRTQGPASLLATILQRPNLQVDLMGYTGQNAFFFADVAADTNVLSDVMAVQLGYWLHNYVLGFPGPILNKVAAAAYLNLQLDSFQRSAVQDMVARAVYSGPFCSLDRYYWREELGALLDEHNGDIATAPSLKDLELERVVGLDEVAFYCVLSQNIIAEKEAAVNPDWIPPGAQMTRIREKDFDELSPMLKA